LDAHQAPSDAMDVIARRSIVRAGLFLGIPVSVDRRIALPFFRKVFEGEDGGDGTNRDAGATIDAFGRIDIELFFVFKLRLVLAGIGCNRPGRRPHMRSPWCRCRVRQSRKPCNISFIRQRPGTTLRNARRAKFSYTTARQGQQGHRLIVRGGNRFLNFAASIGE